MRTEVPRVNLKMLQSPKRRPVRNPPTDEVPKLQAVLETSPRPAGHQLIAVMEALRHMGPLPDDVVADTKIGIAVYKVSKDDEVDEDVRFHARELLALWKEFFRKRKAMDAEPGQHEVGDTLTDAARSPKTPKKQSIGVGELYESPESYIKRMRSVAKDHVETRSPKIKAIDSLITPTKEERRQTLIKGGEAVLLKEVEAFLQSHDNQATMNEINAHILKVWSGSALVLADTKKSRRGAPLFGKEFVDRHDDRFELGEDGNGKMVQIVKLKELN